MLGWAAAVPKADAGLLGTGTDTSTPPGAGGGGGRVAGLATSTGAGAAPPTGCAKTTTETDCCAVANVTLQLPAEVRCTGPPSLNVKTDTCLAAPATEEQTQAAAQKSLRTLHLSHDTLWACPVMAAPSDREQIY
ncbi:UNVERIFIED_CONTAM: hypothetical protein K2H54_007967 [Gekko kuhli]